MPVEGHFAPLPEGYATLPTRSGKYLDIEVFGNVNATSGTLGDLTVTGTITIGAGGSIDVGSGTINVGDIESDNWGGASPANLTARDTSGTPAGYYLDDSLGSAQFEGDLFVGGDITLSGTLGLDGTGIFQTDSSAPRWIVDIDNYGALDLVYESGLTNEYAVGGIDVVNIEAGGTEWAGVILKTPQIGDATNRGQAVVQLGSVENATDEYGSAILQATGWGSHDAYATLDAITNTGDAAINIRATSTGGGAATIGIASDNFSVAQSGSPQVYGTALEWQTWTPTLVNITEGNGTLNCRQMRIGDTVHLYFEFTLGSTSSIGSGPRVEYPVTPRDDPAGVGRAEDTGTVFYPLNIYHSASDMKLGTYTAGGTYTQITSLTSTLPFTWTTGDRIVFSITYEAA